MEIKDLLYQSIDEIGREKIRIDLISDVQSSKKYINQILKKCIHKLGLDVDKHKLSILCEALLHFMLTASSLPSERKIDLSGIELDIVIPSLKNLEKNSNKSLIIQVIKNDNHIEAKIKNAKAKQLNQEHIWLVSANPLNVNYRNYHLEEDANFPYSSIIVDIDKFLKDNNVKSLPLVYD